MIRPALAPLLALTCSALFVAESAARSISARIICLQHSQGVESVCFGPSPEKKGPSQRLLIGDYSLPFPVEIEDETLTVLKESGETAARAKVPPDASHVTLLFVPGNETAYRIFVMPDSASKFMTDHTRILNLSSLPVRFRIEDQLIDLPVGKLQTLTALPKRDRHNMANVTMASLIRDEWKVVSQTQWHLVEGNRQLVLVYMRPGTQRLVSVSYRDRPGAEKAAATANAS